MKKVVAFDLDDTLAITKSPINDRMSELLGELIKQYQVCVISGGWFPQFEKQVVNELKIERHYLQNLHLMPTCGTRYYRYDAIGDEWKLIYSEDIPEKDKKRIIDALTDATKRCGYYEEKPYGELAQDRFSQITYSALGQDAPPNEKYLWDPDTAKRRQIRDLVIEELSDYEVRIGGTTSIDVTIPGVDKAYGMEKLMQTLEISKDEILFVGDKLRDGGNDYPVKAMGIDCVEVKNHEDTELVIKTILAVTPHA